MATESQGRTLHYRHVVFQNAKGPLQKLLANALKAKQHPKERLEPLDAIGRDHRLINYVSTQKGMLCGNMFSFTQGAAQLLMREKEVKQAEADAASYPLETLAAPSGGDGKAEFLEAILYFCVYGDHVLMLQARALRANAFEQYVGWLLSESGVLADDQTLFLADQPSAAAASAIRRAHVKAVSIGMPFIEAAPDQTESKRAKLTVAGPIFRMLRDLLGSQKVDHMKLEDALDGNIEATIELRWARRTTDEAQHVLDNLAVAMRNVDPEDVEIRLLDGTKVKGDQLKLAVPIHVSVRDNVVHQGSLFKTMREQMKHLIETGAIQPP